MKRTCFTLTASLLASLGCLLPVSLAHSQVHPRASLSIQSTEYGSFAEASLEELQRDAEQMAAQYARESTKELAEQSGHEPYEGYYDQYDDSYEPVFEDGFLDEITADAEDSLAPAAEAPVVQLLEAGNTSLSNPGSLDSEYDTVAEQFLAGSYRFMDHSALAGAFAEYYQDQRAVLLGDQCDLNRHERASLHQIAEAMITVPARRIAAGLSWPQFKTRVLDALNAWTQQAGRLATLIQLPDTPDAVESHDLATDPFYYHAGLNRYDNLDIYRYNMFGQYSPMTDRLFNFAPRPGQATLVFKIDLTSTANQASTDDTPPALAAGTPSLPNPHLVLGLAHTLDQWGQTLCQWSRQLTHYVGQEPKLPVARRNTQVTDR